MLDPARLKSTGVHWLRGEPRQCADRAHRLIPPSLAPTGERRPSMACLRPIPAPPRLSPAQCPWLRRCRLRHASSKRGVPHREGRRCKGISSERYMDVPRPRVGAGRATTRRTKSPCSGGPARSEALALAAAAHAPSDGRRTKNAPPTVGSDGAGRCWRPRMWRQCIRRCDGRASAHRGAPRRGIQRASQPPSTGITAPLT